MIALGACALIGGCTRSTDLAANVQLDASTTTLRIPVYRVPRTTTSLETPTTVVDDPVTATTTPAVAADPAAPPPASGGLNGLAALVGAVQRATTPAPGAKPVTTRPVAPTPTTPPTPTTSTTVIPPAPQAIVIAATNVEAHPGETQWIDISIDGHRVGTVACTGRDYQQTPAGWINAGFATAIDCPTDGSGPRLRRTLPASAAPGQYAFCTEIDPDSPTTVCTPYKVTPYPT